MSAACAKPAAAERGDRWPLERVLFAIAGTVVLIGALLSALVSPWFLLLVVLMFGQILIRPAPTRLRYKDRTH